MNVTLRIKRIYFDEILNKTKKIEYRAVKNYYQRMFEGRTEVIKTMTLHYQQERKMLCDVVKIVRMKTPAFFADDPDPCDITDEVYAIHLKNPKLIRGR